MCLPAFPPASYQTDHTPESLRSPNAFSPGRYRLATHPTNQPGGRSRKRGSGLKKSGCLKKKKNASHWRRRGMTSVKQSGLHNVDAEAISPRIACYESLFSPEHPALSASWGNVFWLRGAGALPCIPFSFRPPAHMRAAIQAASIRIWTLEMWSQ